MPGHQRLRSPRLKSSALLLSDVDPDTEARSSAGQVRMQRPLHPEQSCQSLSQRTSESEHLRPKKASDLESGLTLLSEPAAELRDISMTGSAERWPFFRSSRPPEARDENNSVPHPSKHLKTHPSPDWPGLCATSPERVWASMVSTLESLGPSRLP